MPLPIGALSIAQQAMLAHNRRFDDAAARVARVGLDADGAATSQGSISTGETPAASFDQLADNLVTMLLAQRAFSAASRVAETADKMLEEAVKLGDTPPSVTDSR